MPEVERSFIVGGGVAYKKEDWHSDKTKRDGSTAISITIRGAGTMFVDPQYNDEYDHNSFISHTFDDFYNYRVETNAGQIGIFNTIGAIHSRPAGGSI